MASDDDETNGFDDCRWSGCTVRIRLRGAPAASGEVFPVNHTDADWRKILTSAQYEMLRERGTERPFTSPLLHEERRGTFAKLDCSSRAQTLRFMEERDYGLRVM